VVHTLNLRLHPDDLAYIANHAGDRVLLVDEMLLPLYEQLRDKVSFKHVVVISEEGSVPDWAHAYEELLENAHEDAFSYPDLDESRAAAMCYSSGTTGRPKAVLYSHRALVLHSFGAAMADTLAIRETDVVLPVVPMFHANAWGLPYVSTMVGAKQIFPGPHLDPTSLLELFQNEKVTLTAGVPTIWLGILQVLDNYPDAYDLSALRAMFVGGSAAPESMIRGYEERHGLKVLHAWGMTETGPIATVANLTSELKRLPEAERYKYRAKQGYPMAFVDVRLVDEEGVVPRDGKTMGEIEVRGPWVAAAYYNSPEGDEKFTEDGWLKTGDIATVDKHGFIEIQDRSKDLIKSGGEWISSVAIENTLMAHPAVAEAAVIAISDPKWQERPLAVVVLKEGQSATTEELISHLKPCFARWWLPDAVEFVNEIPRTSTGKFMKTKLREQFKDYQLVRSWEHLHM
jgi:fatty-acyl-CoA synthase